LPAGSAGRRERADAILDAAADLLRAHGYRRVSVDDVATRAGVGKGTIYLHWRTREALFWAVLQRETLRLLEQLIADLAADAELALPQRLIGRLFIELDGRPLVRARKRRTLPRWRTRRRCWHSFCRGPWRPRSHRRRARSPGNFARQLGIDIGIIQAMSRGSTQA
jgi:AcrR family transcriptional regulator